MQFNFFFFFVFTGHMAHGEQAVMDTPTERVRVGITFTTFLKAPPSTLQL